MSLARAESRRLFKRRFTKLLVLGVLLILAATAVGTFFSNQKVGAAQIQQAKAEADGYYQQALVSAANEKEQCLRAPGTSDAPNWPADCNQLYTPSPDEYDYTWYMPATFDLRAEFPLMLAVLALVLGAAAFVIGASFVGSEWNSGNMMNLLLWRPQRLRVLNTKLGVFLGWLAGLAVVLIALWAVAFQLIAQVRGTTEKMTSGVWQSFGLAGLRGLAFILVAGALGFALASLGRHTGMALGALIGVGAVQIGVYIMAQLAEFKYPEAYLAPVWIYAWLDKEVVLPDYNSCDFSATAGCEPKEFIATWPVAGTGMAVLLVLIVGAAMWTMRKRDIT